MRALEASTVYPATTKLAFDTKLVITPSRLDLRPVAARPALADVADDPAALRVGLPRHHDAHERAIAQLAGPSGTMRHS